MADQEIEQLLTMLRTDDPPVDPGVLKHVVSELRTKEKAKVTAALIPGLQDPEAEYCCTIASVFLKFDFATAIQHVPILLQDVDDGVQGFLCLELGKHRRPEAVPHLIGVLMRDPEDTHRVIAAWGLGNIGDPMALPSLKLAMQNDTGKDHEGRPVKEIAAEAIRRITHEKAATSVA